MAEQRIEVRLPDLGDVGEVKLVEWLVAAGESVAAGEDLVEVETEKTTFVVPAPASGRVARIAIDPGGTARAGDLLGEIEGG